MISFREVVPATEESEQEGDELRLVLGLYMTL